MTKDVKLRTFISQEKSRNNLASLVYDVTYGVVQPQDNLVCVDDSIVRGTTLGRSILRILKRLQPKKIVIVSTAPQIRYPDCYGIDMAKLEDFIAFKAALALHQERGTMNLVEEIYHRCVAQAELPDQETINHVTAFYEPFTVEEISRKIGELLTPQEVRAEVEIVFQTIENLHLAIPMHQGDWYFTGQYPTPGGMRVVNRAFINFYEGKNERAY